MLDHAETVKQLSQQEALVTELQQQQAAHEASGQAAHKAKVCCLGSMGINGSTSYAINCAVNLQCGTLIMMVEESKRRMFSWQFQQHHKVQD